MIFSLFRFIITLPRIVGGALLLSLFCTLPLAYAGDGVDTRVTFSIADNDLLSGPQSDTCASPSLPNSLPVAECNRAFYDDFERRDRGFENLSHLVLYMHEPGYFEGLDTEAALVLRTEVLDNKGLILKDDGSYIKLTQVLDSGDKLVVTAFPMSADRFRLGYSYDISWGGNEMFPKDSKASPGLRVGIEGDYYYGFLGAKTGLAKQNQDDRTIEQDTVWGLLGGAGIHLADELLLEAGGGFFHRGIIDKEELKIPEGNRVKTAPWQGYGASMQITYHVGMPIGTPIDFKLYKNDPLKGEDEMLAPEEYDTGLSFLIKSEATVLGQTLQDVQFPTSTTNQLAVAGDLTASVKTGRMRLFALGVYRSLAFILYNVPSLTPFVAMPDGITAFPEVFASVGADISIPSVRVTPGISFGVQRPAYITSAIPSGNATPAFQGEQKLVYRSATRVDLLNPEDSVALVYAGKLTTKWELSPSVTAAGEFQVTYDENRRFLNQDTSGIGFYDQAPPLSLGVNFLLKARF